MYACGSLWWLWAACGRRAWLFIVAIFISPLAFVLQIYSAFARWSEVSRPVKLWARGVVLYIVGLVLLSRGGVFGRLEHWEQARAQAQRQQAAHASAFPSLTFVQPSATPVQHTPRPFSPAPVWAPRPQDTTPPRKTATPDQLVAKLQRIAAGWHVQGSAVPLDIHYSGGHAADGDATVIAGFGSRLETQTLTPPIAFHITALGNGNDIRMAFAADQVIFNWEMRPTELRVDGGPANGQHKPGAGRLPDGTWVGIEWVVKPDEMVIYVDGQERYRIARDFSTIRRSFSIYAHNGSMAIKSVEAVRP